jgi:hypothetical protein
LTGKRVLNTRQSSMPSKRTCVPNVSVDTLLREVHVDMERVRGVSEERERGASQLQWQPPRHDEAPPEPLTS